MSIEYNPSDLNRLFLLQRELYSRENAQLKGLLQYLQLQPQPAIMTPSLTNLDAVRNGMVSSWHDTGAAGAPHQAPAPGNAPVTVDRMPVQHVRLSNHSVSLDEVAKC